MLSLCPCWMCFCILSNISTVLQLILVSRLGLFSLLLRWGRKALLLKRYKLTSKKRKKIIYHAFVTGHLTDLYQVCFVDVTACHFMSFISPLFCLSITLLKNTLVWNRCFLLSLLLLLFLNVSWISFFSFSLGQQCIYETLSAWSLRFQ